MDITNDTQLRVVFEEKIRGAIENVSDKVLELLRRQIETDVFTTPNTWYERTGQFENAWKWGSIERVVNGLVREMSYDSKSVGYEDGTWTHGNPGQSASENLADILNLAWNGYRDGYTSSLMFGRRHFSHKRKPYWDNFIKKLFDRKELKKMFSEELRSQGLNIIE